VLISDRVAAFIIRNNAILEEIEDLLDEATNKALRRVVRRRALGTAGHLACRGLRRLHAADNELWIPLQDQQLKVRWDSNNVAYVVQADIREIAAPRASVSPELLRLFRHPRPDDAADRINQTDRLLEQIVRDPPEDPRSHVERAKKSVSELCDETCALINAKIPAEQFFRVVFSAAGAMAMGSLGAAGCRSAETCLEGHA
jgi:hypothetical protein